MFTSIVKNIVTKQKSSIVRNFHLLGRHGESISIYEKALKLKEDNFESLRNIGFHTMQLGGFKNAIPFFVNDFSSSTYCFNEKNFLNPLIGFMFSNLGFNASAENKNIVCEIGA